MIIIFQIANQARRSPGKPQTTKKLSVVKSDAWRCQGECGRKYLISLKIGCHLPAPVHFILDHLIHRAVKSFICRFAGEKSTNTVRHKTFQFPVRTS